MKKKIIDIKFYIDKKMPQTLMVSFTRVVGTMKIGYPSTATLGICTHPDDAAKLVKILNKLSHKNKLTFFNL